MGTVLAGGVLANVLAFAIAMWVLYFCIKCGVRDGIKAANDTMRRDAPTPTARAVPPSGDDFRASR